MNSSIVRSGRFFKKTTCLIISWPVGLCGAPARCLPRRPRDRACRPGRRRYPQTGPAAPRTAAVRAAAWGPRRAGRRPAGRRRSCAGSCSPGRTRSAPWRPHRRHRAVPSRTRMPCGRCKPSSTVSTPAPVSSTTRPAPASETRQAPSGPIATPSGSRRPDGQHLDCARPDRQHAPRAELRDHDRPAARDRHAVELVEPVGEHLALAVAGPVERDLAARGGDHEAAARSGGQTAHEARIARA